MDLQSGGDASVKASPVVDRADDLDAVGLRDDLVVLAEARGDVDDAGALLGRDEVAESVSLRSKGAVALAILARVASLLSQGAP